MRSREEIEKLVERALTITTHSDLVKIELLLDIRDLLRAANKFTPEELQDLVPPRRNK